MKSKNIRIVRRRYLYEARLPIIGIKAIRRGDEVQLIMDVAKVMNSARSLEDSREYGIWYGKHLGLSEGCKQGLETIVQLRNKVIGN